MLSAAAVAAFLLLAVFLHWLYLTLSRLGRAPSVYHRPDSRACAAIVGACSALTGKYTPPLLWSASGHLQSAYNVLVGGYFVPIPRGERRELLVADGSTVTYEFYESGVASSLIYLVCPGIGNSCESHYIKSFVNHMLSNGHSVAVLNHIGTLRGIPLTGNRIFTYGGTGDLAAVFEDLLSRSPAPCPQFVLVGFSLGANIAVRFIGERVTWRRHFVCAISVCQGYDPNQAFGIFPSTSCVSRLYSHRINSKQLSLMRRHRSNLVGETPLVNLRDPSRRDGGITHDGHDCNGFALDVGKISRPNERLMWLAESIHELDEYYTRRIMGFQSVREMWQWMSCEELMKTVTDFPLLLVNTCDDPVIPQEVHSIPLHYTELNPYAMFVSTQHGGHLGFFEGGLLLPNKATWLERLVLQYSTACRDKMTFRHSDAY